jgi:hypothetical protein
MIKRIIPILIALSVLLSACGTPAALTMSPADVEGTAMSSAWTMVAATQQAIPTATPLPPTEIPSPTPLPTFTALPPLDLPTLAPLPTATTAAAAGDCTGALDMGEAGAKHNVRIENQTGSQVNLSLNLYKPNLFGQCGSISYVIAKNEKVKVGIPSGYWYAYSWVISPPSTGEVSFYLGPSGSTDLLRLILKKDVIAWVGP